MRIVAAVAGANQAKDLNIFCIAYNGHFIYNLWLIIVCCYCFFFHSLFPRRHHALAQFPAAKLLITDKLVHTKIGIYGKRERERKATTLFIPPAHMLLGCKHSAKMFNN